MSVKGQERKFSSALFELTTRCELDESPIRQKLEDSRVEGLRVIAVHAVSGIGDDGRRSYASGQAIPHRAKHLAVSAWTRFARQHQDGKLEFTDGLA
jgi:hypothetical protein